MAAKRSKQAGSPNKNNATTEPVKVATELEEALFVDRYRLARDSPVGRWAIYVADALPGSLKLRE